MYSLLVSCRTLELKAGFHISNERMNGFLSHIEVTFSNGEDFSDIQCYFKCQRDHMELVE